MDFDKERKRTMGEIACAECRRLKSRCDKQVPCSTCIKRGCEILCPNSTMPPGEGSRFVAVAETYLRRKIVRMEERMHSLEDALAIIQGPGSRKSYSTSNETWQNRGTKWTPEVNHGPNMDSEFIKYGLIDALGSLYLDEGPPSDLSDHNHNSESLLHQAKAFMSETSSPVDHAEEVNSSYLPAEINVFYTAFPFTPTGIPTKPVQDLIESYLPLLPRAEVLCETFLQSTSWMFSIVSRQTAFGELIPAIYKHASPQMSAPPRSYGPHDIALLFIIFAIGALLDHSLPPYNIEGQHYHMLSRAALCLQPVFTQRSVVTVKVLNLMSIYNAMCGIESKLRNCCSLLNLAAHVALQIGFHHDPSVWKIADREAYERRAYFWNLVSATVWQSLIAGQPPLIIPSSIHCRIPTEEEESIYQVGEVPLGFGTWTFNFTRECLIPVMEATESACPPSYDSILALDREIREFSVPQALGDKNTMPDQMQAFVRRQLRDLTLLFLHRSFFAQALTECPWDPLRSQFRQSFLSAYQSAVEVLRTSLDQFQRQPTLCARIWRFWTFTFLAAVIIGTVAMRQLSVNLEPEPLRQLDLACEFFQGAAQTSIRAQKALPILLRLRQEAKLARLETSQGASGNAPSSYHHRDVDNNYGTFVDTSSVPIRYPTSSIPRPGAPSSSSSKYMQALPVPVIHPPLATITSHDEGHRAVPTKRLYSDIPSTTNLGASGLTSRPSRQSSSGVRSTPNDGWNLNVHDMRPY